jgi:urease accessory protein
MLKRLTVTAAVLAATAAPAFAHLDPVAHGSLAAGLSHPLSGADHMLAMIAVGLWAGQLGGRARMAVPAAFVLVLAAGFALALAGLPLPFVEPAILASVLGLGLLVALAVRVPTPFAAAAVGVFALFHGHAHGAELGAASALGFGAGFIVSTALLHAAGLALGQAVHRMPALTRLLGIATLAGGAWLAVA